jgi:multidrug efflux pump subunit AcrA (membrane-fusion protein)
MVTPFSSAAESKGAVVTMADMSTLEVEADVSESSLAKIEVGQPCEITLDALPDVRFKGRISRIVPTVDRAKATVMTKVRFDAIDPRVLPEMSAKVSFLSREVTSAEQKPLVAVDRDARRQARRVRGAQRPRGARAGDARHQGRRADRDRGRREVRRQGRAEAIERSRAGFARQDRGEVTAGSPGKR